MLQGPYVLLHRWTRQHIFWKKRIFSISLLYFPLSECGKTHSICGDLCLITVGVAETVREMLEILFPVRARSDRERRKGTAGDEGGRGWLLKPLLCISGSLPPSCKHVQPTGTLACKQKAAVFSCVYSFRFLQCLSSVAFKCLYFIQKA